MMDEKNEYSGSAELGWGFVTIFVAMLAGGIALAVVILI